MNVRVVTSPKKHRLERESLTAAVLKETAKATPPLVTGYDDCVWVPWMPVPIRESLQPTVLLWITLQTSLRMVRKLFMSQWISGNSRKTPKGAVNMTRQREGRKVDGDVEVKD